MASGADKTASVSYADAGDDIDAATYIYFASRTSRA